jgi:hypothetical protein
MMADVRESSTESVMPLLDHFRPPLSLRRHWHAFHNAWATYLSSQINGLLPPGYFAEPNVQFDIEIDVAAWEETTLTAPAVGWLPSMPALTVPLPVLTDLVEIQIFASSGGPRLAGAIELVSPANKDQPAHCDAFVSKCAAYVQEGIGLIMVDVVTERHGNLHRELLARLQVPAPPDPPDEIYAAAYHPVRRDDDPSLDIWVEALTLGRELPTLPLWLRGGPCLRVDLEAAYQRTCLEQRVMANGA